MGRHVWISLLLVAACEGDAPLVDAGATPEVCNNGRDDDLDQRIDCADADCASAPGCMSTAKELICTDLQDNDKDGATDCDDSDCAAELACYEVWDDPNDFTAGTGLPELDLAVVRPTWVSGKLYLPIEVYYTWPPSDAIYSWSVTVQIITDDYSASWQVIHLSAQGSRQTMPFGSLSASDVTFTDTNDGPTFVFDNLPTTATRFRVTTRVRYTENHDEGVDVLGDSSYYPLPPRS